MADLKTDYKDDILDTSQNINRTFTIKDSSGNILYQDCQIEETTVFETEGDEMNAQVINNTNTEVNNLNDNLTADDDLKFRFATDGEGNHGYLGADDSFIPFSSGSEIIYLGTGTSFNLQTLGITGWQNFTNDNFIVEMASSADSGQSGRTDCQHPRFTITPNKSYDSSTGVLTASISGYGWATNGAWYEHNSTTTAVKAYLVIGDIENI